MEESSEFKNYLDKSIEHCVKDTLKELTVGPKNSDILEAFLRSFKKKKLIARNPNKYFSDEDERIFFLHENCLYFKGEALTRYISNVLKKYVSVITLSKELNEANLLVHFGKSYSERLPAAISQFDSSTRYYRIDVSLLSDMLIAKYEKIAYMIFPLYRMLQDREESEEENVLQQAQEEGYYSRHK